MHAVAATSPSVAELAALQSKARLADDLCSILHAPGWTPTQRTAFALMVQEAQAHPDSAYRTIDDAKICDMAEQFNLHRNTLGAAIEQFTTAGLIEHRVEKRWFNRNGDPLKPGVKGDKRRGDKCRIVASTIAIGALPGTLPELGESKRETTANRIADGKRREFAELKTKLDNILAGVACPHCGEVGHLQGEITATCDACHELVTQAQLAVQIDGQAMPESVHSVSAMRKSPATKRPTPRNVQPAPSPTTVGFDDPGVEIRVESVHSVSARNDSPALSECTVEESTELFAPSVIPANVETITGMASVEHLAGFGGMFSLADREKHGINGRDGMGAPICYLDMPLAYDAPAITAHMAAGGSVGLLPAQCSMAVLDDDMTGGELLRAYPRLALADRVFRRNAPGRVKVVLMCPDPGESRTFKSADGTRKIELIGKGKHAIIAGVHSSGAPIELAPAYEAVLMTWAELVTIAEGWCGVSEQPDTQLSASKPCIARAAAVAQIPLSGIDAVPYVDQVRLAIAAYNADPSNQMRAAAAASTLRKRGQYVALRADDGTPSTRQFSPDAWRDYGDDDELKHGVTDAFDMLIHAERKDKRRACFEVVNEWRVTQGARPLPDKAGAA